jgi:hypothetical protein
LLVVGSGRDSLKFSELREKTDPLIPADDR